MSDPKYEEYVPCPKCGGAKRKGCPVCHGLGTVPQSLIDWGKRRNLELVWSEGPAEAAEKIANASEKKPEPKELEEFPELFMPGDLVVWREKPWRMQFPDDDFGEWLREIVGQIQERYGEGPFRILSVDTSFIDDSDDVPQLSLADMDGNALPRNASHAPRRIAATWFTKLPENA